MAKIPFDIKFRPQIESGEYKVETKAGCPVRIVCWDMACELPILGLVLLNDEKAEEMAVGFTNEGTNLLGEPLYDKLFIVTPEEKLTTLEDHLSTYLKNDFEYFLTKKWDEKKWNETMRIQAAELLSLAKNQLQKEGLVTMGHLNIACEAEYQSGLAEGKAEALRTRATVLTENLAKSRLDKDSIPYHIIEFMCNLYTCQNWKEIEDTAELYVTRIKAAALKDLPRWKKAKEYMKLGPNDYVFTLDSDGKCSPYWDTEVEKGQFYITESDIENLPKED